MMIILCDLVHYTCSSASKVCEKIRKQHKCRDPNFFRSSTFGGQSATRSLDDDQPRVTILDRYKGMAGIVPALLGSIASAGGLVVGLGSLVSATRPKDELQALLALQSRTVRGNHFSVGFRSMH